jgi:hypothetical protein
VAALAISALAVVGTLPPVTLVQRSLWPVVLLGSAAGRPAADALLAAAGASAAFAAAAGCAVFAAVVVLLGRRALEPQLEPTPSRH